MALELFARIGDIKGESKDEKHKEEIDLLTWAWGVTGTASNAVGAGTAMVKTKFADFSFTHYVDKASPVLMKTCATGEHIKEATISVRKAGRAQQDYFIIKMNDVVITSIMPGGSREDAATLETVTLQFGMVDVEYKAQKPDGSLDAGVHFKYDLKTNRIP